MQVLQEKLMGAGSVSQAQMQELQQLQELIR
jgi:hypothetical protein